VKEKESSSMSPDSAYKGRRRIEEEGKRGEERRGKRK